MQGMRNSVRQNCMNARPQRQHSCTANSTRSRVAVNGHAYITPHLAADFQK